MNALMGALFALVFTAACGSTGIGDIFGGGTPTTTTSEIRGTVDNVDVNNRSILLTNVSYGSSLSSGGNTVRVYFDDQTTVEYQGRAYRPEDLERGDQVAVRAEDSGGRLTADAMTVLHDVSGGSTGSYASTVRGTVRYIDTSRQLIEIDRASSSDIVSLSYDASTVVTFDGRQYRPADLERGDEIEIEVRQLSGGRLMANSVYVVRSVSDATTTASTLRGTVRMIDTSRRTIELERTNWSSRFTTGNNNVVVVQYDANTDVEYQGRLYPPTNLERGDIVDVQVRNTGTTLVAQRIVVVQNVNALR